jgi:hypothetical protein
MLHEVEEDGLSPVDVVKDDHERPLGSPRLEELAECPRDLLGRASGRVLAEDRAQRYDLPLARSELLQDLGDGPVADSLAVGEAAATHHRRTFECAQEFVCEARLPDSGRAEDREQVARALRRHGGEDALEQLPLPVAPHHRRVVPPGRSLGAYRAQAVGLEPLRLALRLDRLRGLAVHRVAHEPVGLLAEQDLAGLGCLL